MDRILAIECAFYFDRLRFYRRAAQVLKRDGLVVLADIAFADRAAFLTTCEALSTTQEKFAVTVFERVFKDFGLPGAIRTDNGVPFAAPTALYRLSKLSVWWLRLGIQIELTLARTRPR